MSRTEYYFNQTEPFLIESGTGKDVIACYETLTTYEFGERGGESGSNDRKLVILDNKPSKEEVFRYKLLGKIYRGE